MSKKETSKKETSKKAASKKETSKKGMSKEGASKTTVFSTQYKTLLTVLATVLVLVFSVLWFFDRRDERKLKEHLFELPPAVRENLGGQWQQGAGTRGIF